jgi:acetyl esterase/lipase
MAESVSRIRSITVIRTRGISNSRRNRQSDFVITDGKTRFLDSFYSTLENAFMSARSAVFGLLLSLAVFPWPNECTADQGVMKTTVEYARVGETSLKLDFYRDQAVVKVSPLIVWVHGGAWRKGSRASMPLEALVTRGYAIASVDYRLTPEAKFPANVHDIKGAIRYLRSHASELGVDPDHFVVAGSSAGGHLAALVGVSAGVDQLEGDVGGNTDVSSDVQAIVSFFGASNLTTILDQSTPHGLSVRVPALQLLLGDQPQNLPALARMASPVFHVDPSDPPLLLLHGDQDPQMPINQSHELQGAYARVSRPCEFIVVHGGIHGGDMFFTPDQIRQVEDYLRRHAL